jgi:hypothetical protein
MDKHGQAPPGPVFLRVSGQGQVKTAGQGPQLPPLAPPSAFDGPSVSAPTLRNKCISCK